MIDAETIRTWRINYGLDTRTPEQAMRWWSGEMHGCAPLALIHTLVTRLDERAVESYASEPDRGLTSTRRMAKGKPPLRYSWRTVVVKPATPNVAVATSDVAHRASPRAHSRRGHWRSLRTGKRVWIRDCRVGNPALGEVMHDYRVERG